MFITIQLTARVELPDPEFQALTEEQSARYRDAAAELVAERAKNWFKGRAASVSVHAEFSPAAPQSTPV